VKYGLSSRELKAALHQLWESAVATQVTLSAQPRLPRFANHATSWRPRECYLPVAAAAASRRCCLCGAGAVATTRFLSAEPGVRPNVREVDDEHRSAARSDAKVRTTVNFTARV